MASPSVGELSPEFCCTDSNTFELLKHIQREIQGYAPFVLPLVLLLGFGVLFAAASLGGSMLGFDDHPGQLYRVWHVMTYGPAPWAWDRGWWAGYPELQFYPPGFAYLGALLASATTGVFDVRAVYQALLWLAYLLPGITTYVVMVRLTGRRWLSLPAAFVALPLPLVLGALAVAAVVDRAPMSAGARLALWWLPAMIVVTALDRFAAEPLGLHWLPADRVVDGAWMALVVAGGVGAARLARRLEAAPFMPRGAVALRAPAVGLGTAVAFALLSIGSETLLLRPRPADWPSLISIERGLRLPDFWSLLSRLPEGRILFTRSGVPLVYGANWWRPHTHVTALAPAESGRDIVLGTSTNPPPLDTRRGDDGLLEVRLTRATQTVTLRYAAGGPELAGLALSAAALVAWAAAALKSR